MTGGVVRYGRGRYAVNQQAWRRQPSGLSIKNETHIQWLKSLYMSFFTLRWYDKVDTNQNAVYAAQREEG